METAFELQRGATGIRGTRMPHPARRKIPMDKTMEAMEHKLWIPRHCFNWLSSTAHR
jgi:hypothetical protein